MSRFYSYLNTAVRIVGQYQGESPLAAWLKDFFRAHKQMGSKDRKQITELVYGYYRLGHGVTGISAEERILCGSFLCNRASSLFLAELNPELDELIGLPLSGKLQVPYIQKAGFDIGAVFPWQGELSEGVDTAGFGRSFLQQPDVFVRIRPGFEKTVKAKLFQAGIPFQDLEAGCVAFAPAQKLEGLLEVDREVVVQDASSQRTGDYFFQEGCKDSLSVWDCCAASGGKSIMAYDRCPTMRLTVSDIRASILHNLGQRFTRAGIGSYRSLLTDLSRPGAAMPSGNFDVILADVPCSGSGTWARTPEQLFYFEPSKIDHYRHLQQKILTNAVSKLEKGGRMVYITCSVFKKENEGMLRFAEEQLELKVAASRLIQGFGMRADTMFLAVLTKQ